MYSETIKSSLGLVTITSDGAAITSVRFCDKAPDDNPDSITSSAAKQLREYFAGQRQAFSIPLNAVGTAFQQRVWTALASIPYGQTASYREIATAIDNQKAVRAVGLANGRNPIAIVVPCHRIIGSNGKLTGYAGGLERKQALLALEGVNISQ